jgi:uncharacterized membrane protein
MAFMALDHARLFIAKNHPREFWGVGLPRYDEALPFLLRLVTHFCAPGFFLLLGAGVALFAVSRKSAGWTEGKITRFLLVRGLLLIVLQLTVENFAWSWGMAGARIDPYGVTRIPGTGESVLLNFGVLYSLGASLLLFSLFRRLPTLLLLLFSAFTLLVPEVLLPSPKEAMVSHAPLFRLLFLPGQTGIMQVYYPLIPWAGVTGFGVLLGRAFLWDPARTFRWAPFAGLASLLLFGVLRAIGSFGNLHPLEESGWIPFLNMTKYPPSLTFLLLTLGGNLLLLSLLHTGGGLHPWQGNPVRVFGRTALFFYLIHLYLFGAAGRAFPSGSSFPVLLLLWLAGLGLLLPLCRAYGRWKENMPPGSVLRFF